MLIKEVKYTDYNDVERTEKLHFHLSKAELAEMELSVDGGLSAKLKRITETLNGPEIVKFFKEFILKSYGVISDDGRTFRKSEEARMDFEQSEAYSELFMELITDPDKATEFLQGIIPKMPQDGTSK